jgi:hypothetical protein
VVKKIQELGIKLVQLERKDMDVFEHERLVSPPIKLIATI